MKVETPRMAPKSVPTFISTAFVLATGVLGLSTSAYLLFQYATGEPRLDLGLGTLLFMMFTWPIQLGGALTSAVLRLHPDCRPQSIWVGAAFWIHVSAAIAWVTFLLLAGSP